MADKDWKVKTEWSGLKGTLVVEHVGCGRTTRIALDRASGSTHCGCGAEITFKGDDMREIQKSLDRLKDIFRK